MIATGAVSFALAMSLAVPELGGAEVAVGVPLPAPRVKSSVAPIVIAITRSSPTPISNHFRPEPFRGGGPRAAETIAVAHPRALARRARTAEVAYCLVEGGASRPAGARSSARSSGSPNQFHTPGRHVQHTPMLPARITTSVGHQRIRPLHQKVCMATGPAQCLRPQVANPWCGQE